MHIFFLCMAIHFFVEGDPQYMCLYQSVSPNLTDMKSEEYVSSYPTGLWKALSTSMSWSFIAVRQDWLKQDDVRYSDKPTIISPKPPCLSSHSRHHPKSNAVCAGIVNDGTSSMIGEAELAHFAPWAKRRVGRLDTQTLGGVLVVLLGRCCNFMMRPFEAELPVHWPPMISHNIARCFQAEVAWIKLLLGHWAGRWKGRYARRGVWHGSSGAKWKHWKGMPPLGAPEVIKWLMGSVWVSG